MRALRTSLGLLLVACVSDEPASPTPQQPTDRDAGGMIPADARSPDVPSAFPVLKAVALAAGDTHTCALLQSPGDVVCWGSNANSELGSPQSAASSLPLPVSLPEKAKSISAGRKFSCAILESGKTFCWGNNESGQLGRAPLQAFGAPALVSAPDLTANPTDSVWGGLTGITLGSDHTCSWQTLTGVMLNGKEVSLPYCWGKNELGQLHRIETNGFPSAAPLVPTFDGKKDGSLPLYTLQMAAGTDFTCSLGFVPVPSGSFFERVLCFGANGHNQLGKTLSATGLMMGAPFYDASDALTGLVRVVVGAEHACAVAAKPGGGRGVYCWGAGDKGQTGRTTDTGTDGIAQLLPLGEPELLAAGGKTTCVSVQGKVQCLGASQSGQRGDGTLDSMAHVVPGMVDLPAVTSLSVGSEHVCAIVGGGPKTPGEVRCWGSNRFGQLGDGLDLTKGYADDPNATFVRTRPVAVRER